jgi:hydroxypyruvate isomerase
VYHVQIEEGNVIESIRNYYAYIGNMHVADVPGRHEPGTGEINYPAIANVLRELEYNGVVGLEAFPRADGATAMAQFREIFS